MLKIGIVGAENSHTAAIANLCNVEKRVDARVEMLWGETAEFAQKAADEITKAGGVARALPWRFREKPEEVVPLAAQGTSVTVPRRRRRGQSRMCAGGPRPVNI